MGTKLKIAAAVLVLAVLAGLGVQQVLRSADRPNAAEPPAVPPPLADATRPGEGDPAAAISGAAQQQRDAICVEALGLFVHLYGAEAGNLALKIMATGGLYIGGGIAPKILQQLQNGSFIDAFCNKGRMRNLLERIPVRVILNDETALQGAAAYAAAS